MVSLARISIRRPKLSLGIWAAIAVVLSVIGFGVSNTLSPSITVVPGTQSSRAQQLANAHFGPSQLVPILLQGPKAELNREGPALVSALARRAHTRVMSAWDGGPVTAQLRKSPTAAMIVVSVDQSEKHAVKYDQPQIETMVARYVHAPLKAYVTGQPSIDRAEKSASLAHLRRNELIAIGILFVLLLVGLRAPVAAVLVAAMGAISTLAGFGLVTLVGRLITVDPVAVALGTMTGLALATGFSLLLLDRYHRERAAGGSEPTDAASAAVRELQGTGKAVLIGGTAVAVALLIASAIGPTELMNSLGAGMLTCALFAIGGAVVVMPAALVLLGKRIDAFTFPAPAPLARAWSALVRGGSVVTRYAVFAGFFATVLLAAIAVPALALKSGSPSITQLPANSPARIAFEQVSRVMGPGWATPYDLIIAGRSQPITTPALLDRIARFEVLLAHTPSVKSVTGPDAIASTSTRLKSFGPSLKKSAKISDQSRSGLAQLANGLGQAKGGTQTLSSQLGQAATGAGAIHAGSGQAYSGTNQLLAGSGQIADGLNQALGGSRQALAGAQTLSNNIGQSQTGVPGFASELKKLKAEAANAHSQIATATQQAQQALGALQAVAGQLPAMKSAPGYAAVSGELARAVSALQSLTSSANAAVGTSSTVSTDAANAAFSFSGYPSQFQSLHDNTTKLQDGIRQLQDGISQLANGGGQLHSGLAQLATGLAQLDSGTGQLASGLAAAPGGIAPLTNGLGQMQAAVIKSRGQLPSTAELKQLFKESPGMFSSGYFVLAAIAGAPAVQRADASFVVNLLRGGNAAQILVVPKYASNDPRTAALGTTLTQLANRFAAANHVDVAIGGPAGNLGDLTSVTKSHVWLDVAVTALAVVLLLAIALRAILLPIVATAFSLLVAGAAFGVLQLLFGGSNPPLGGPGYMDPMTIIGVFTVAFTTTVIFSTLLLLRTREAYVTGVGGREAVTVGLRQTAAASTGAGLVMIAALIPFATTNMINVREFGIGIGVAILLDVFIVRPVLLPAAEAVLGWFGWWPTGRPPRTEIDTPAGAIRLPGPHLPHRRPRPANH